MTSNKGLETGSGQREPEKTRYYFTAADIHLIASTKDHINFLRTALEQQGRWQLWAENLLKYDIPELAKLLQSPLNTQQRQEITEIINQANHSVPEQFELTDKH